MASKIRGITIEFGADTGKLDQAFSKLNHEAKETQSQLKDVNKLLRFEPKNTELLAQKQGFLKDKISETTDKLKLLKKAQENMKAEGIDENSKEYQALRREIIDTESSLNHYKDSLEKTSVSLGINSSKLNALGENLKKGGGKIKELGGKIAGIGKELTTKVTLPLVAIGVKGFETAAELEDAMGATDQIFKTSSGEMKKWADGLKAYYGMAEGEALGYANTMGAMLQNIGGLTADEAAKQAQTLTMLAGDLSAMFGGETESAVQALTNALKGNTSMLDNYGMGVTASTIKTKALQMGLIKGAVSTAQMDKGLLNIEKAQKKYNEEVKKHGKNSLQARDASNKLALANENLEKLTKGTSGELSNEAKQAATLALIMEQTADAQGQAAREADGASGSWKSLKTEMAGLTTEIGEQLLPVVTPLIGQVKDWVARFKELSPETKENAVQIGLLVAAIGPVTTLFGGVTGAAGNLVIGLGNLATKSAALGASISAAGGVGPALSGLGAKLGTFAATGGPVIAAVAGLALVGYGAVKLGQHLASDAIPQVDLFGNEVSASTKKAVGAFLDLEEKAKNSLNQLVWSGQAVTEEGANSIIENFSNMKTQVVAKLEEQKNESKTKMQEMFETSKSLNISEKEEILKTLDETYNGRIEKMNQREEEIKAIMNTAKEEKRQLTQEEADQINLIRQGMRDDGVQALSETEAEYKVIMQRMADQGGTISARGAAEVVQNSLKQKEQTIKNANEEYDARIREAEQLRATGGAKAKELADKIIKEAKRQKDESITAAENMHDQVVEQAKGQSKAHINEVDWETGQIKSKWDILKTNVSTKAEEMKKNITSWAKETSSNATRSWEEFKNNIGSKWEELRKNTSEKFQRIKEAITKPITDAKNWVDEKVRAIKNAFNFEWKLPRFKLPKVSIGMAKSERFGIPYPKFNVDWNAEGFIAKRPLILPDTRGGFQGMGEPSTGGEALLPINKLPGYMAEAIEKAKIVANNTVVTYVVLDGDIIAKKVSSTVDKNLNIRAGRSQALGGLA